MSPLTLFFIFVIAAMVVASILRQVAFQSAIISSHGTSTEYMLICPRGTPHTTEHLIVNAQRVQADAVLQIGSLFNTTHTTGQ